MQLHFPWSSRRIDPEQLNRVTRGGTLVPAVPGRLLTRANTVLSRSLYRVRVFPLAAVPLAQRTAVLRNLLRAWAPFADSDYRVVRHGDQALAFAWDRAGGPASVPDTALPEGLLHEPMPQSGVRVVAGLDGYEGQVWQAGWPVATRWWPAPPQAEEWQLFLRSLAPAWTEGVPAEPPPPAPAVWRAQPWAATQSIDDLGSGGSRLERIAVMATAACLVALAAGLARGAWGAWQERESLRALATQSRAAAAPVVAARERALALRGTSDALSRELTAVQPLEVLEHLARALPATGVLLKEFELTGLKLRLGLELSGDVQRSAIIKALQAGGWFTEVVEQRELLGRPWSAFELSLASAAPPLKVVAAAEPAAAANPGANRGLAAGQVRP